MSKVLLPCAVLFFVGEVSAFAQETPEKPATRMALKSPLDSKADWGLPATGGHRVVGIANSCYRCHNVKDVRDDEDLPPGFEEDGWVLLNELRIWANQDRKHYQAYAVLLNDQSKRIARLMGIVDPKTGEPAAHLDARCLACHTAMPVNQMTWSKTETEHPIVSVDTILDKRFNLGVSCEGCHGPSGAKGRGKPGWGQAHYSPPEESFDDPDAEPAADLADSDADSSVNPHWRTWDPQKKFDEYGFWNIRSSVTQAKICLSCHLGNVEQGKIITHSMYAAGHPPLPSFELTGFINQEPRHWRYLSEKSPEVRDAYCKAGGYGCDESELRTSRASLVAALVAAGESARLTADLIDSQAQSPSEKLEKPAWPELANFACFACHHDLERDGWRQTRPRTGAPGRPLLHEWPATLSEIAADSLGVLPEFRALQAELDHAVLTRPFGNQDEILKVARKYSAATEGWARQIAEQPLSIEEGRQLLNKIATVGSEKPLDYDAARQLIWAYASIDSEIQAALKAKDRKPVKAEKEEEEEIDLADALAPAKDELAMKLSTQEPGWMRQKTLTPSEEILKQLADSLVLDLRIGDSTGTQAFKGERRPRPKTEVDLNLTLPKIANYNPAVVQSAFKELLKLNAQ